MSKRTIQLYKVTRTETAAAPDPLPPPDADAQARARIRERANERTAARKWRRGGNSPDGTA